MSIRLSRTRVIAVIIAVIVIAIGGAAAVARLWPVQSHRQITVDYPREGALFPPDFAPPTLEAGRSGEALPLLKQAVESNPGDAAVHNDYGCALVSEGHVAEAIAQFRVAIGLSQDYPDAHNNLASALAQIGQADDAGSEFRKALALRPDYPEAQAGLGTLLTLGGRFSEGIPLLLKSVQGRPQSLTARMGLAIALSESGRPQEALPHAREAVAPRMDRTRRSSSCSAGSTADRRHRGRDRVDAQGVGRGRAVWRPAAGRRAPRAARVLRGLGSEAPLGPPREGRYPPDPANGEHQWG